MILAVSLRTTRLSPAASAQLASLLHPAAAHPWPELLPPHPYGGGRTAYTRVTPEVVVELSTDLAALATPGAVRAGARRADVGRFGGEMRAVEG